MKQKLRITRSIEKKATAFDAVARWART